MSAARWRLALDVAPLRARPAGVGIYALNLCRAISPLMPDRLSLIGLRPEAATALAELAPRSVEAFRLRHYHSWLQLEAPRAARRSRADLVHFTNAGAPLVGAGPYVLTVHDLSVLRMPRSHPVSRLVTVPITLAAIRGARRLIVPSQATAGELSALLRVAPDRIQVVPHAADTLPPAAEPDNRVLADLGLEARGYLLAPGTIEPRKNHARLVAAFERFASDGHQHRLVIVGDEGWHNAALLRRIERSPVRERILRLGYVGPAVMGALIRESAAVCYVSLYEGFGLPIAEAMANGGAVVTSAASAMPEVAGDAAVLVDPHDIDDIARGIEEAVGRRAELVAAGARRAALRSWSDVARETIAVYERALGD